MKPKTRLYTVRTRGGITFALEASTYDEALRRSTSPRIGLHLAHMMQEAVSQIASVNIYQGPCFRASAPVFEDSFFGKS